MPWIHGNINLDDGSVYGGSFFVKADGQLDKVFRPDSQEEYGDQDDEVLTSPVSPRSVYQFPPE